MCVCVCKLSPNELILKQRLPLSYHLVLFDWVSSSNFDYLTKLNFLFLSAFSGTSNLHNLPHGIPHKPEFKETNQNITVGPGDRAVLKCRVDNLGTKTVSHFFLRFIPFPVTLYLKSHEMLRNIWKIKSRAPSPGHNELIWNITREMAIGAQEKYISPLYK